MSGPVQAWVSLGSFGTTLAQRVGQAELARIAAAAGADGVEFRGELQREGELGELGEQARVVREHGLVAVWSSPEGLWSATGTLDAGALARAFETAAVLGAARVKMSLGGWTPACDVDELVSWLDDSSLELLIENDQTAAAGTVPPMRDFFARLDEAGRRIEMTFDIGNWCWTGEDPLAAATVFAEQVGYIHCKGVQRLPGKWVAVPLADSASPWRTVLRRLPANVPRAIEHPIEGDDLVAATRGYLALLRSAEVSA